MASLQGLKCRCHQPSTDASRYIACVHVSACQQQPDTSLSHMHQQTSKAHHGQLVQVRPQTPARLEQGGQQHTR